MIAKKRKSRVLPPGVLVKDAAGARIEKRTNKHLWPCVHDINTRLVELERKHNDLITRVSSNCVHRADLVEIRSDVRYACGQIKAIIDRMNKREGFGGGYIGERWVPQSGDPAVDVIRRVAKMLTDYADSRYGREKL